MSRLDDRLTKDLDRAARPADPAGAFEAIDRRRERRAVLRRAQTALLATVVLAGSVGGVLVLNRAFRGEGGGRTAGGDTTPFPITPKTNGLLAFADGDRLFTVPPQGGDPRPVPNVPNGVWMPAWSPDGMKIALTAFRAHREIWVADAGGGAARLVATADNVSAPSWSPDGAQIAYAADTSEGSSIHIVNADGSDDHVVGLTLQGRDYFSVVFSPDGTRLLYDAGTDSGFGIFVMDVDGSAVTPLGPTNQDYDPAWSPDGERIVFTRQEEGAESDIWVMDADGTDVRQLTNDGPGSTNLYPTFSPDGTKIAYVGGVTGGPGSLTVMDADGGHPVDVVPKDVLGLSWQPVLSAADPVPPAEASSAQPEPGRDIGLAFNLCRLQPLHGVDFLGTGTAGTAWVGGRLAANGSCPDEYLGDSVVAVDVDGDGLAESWAALTHCVGCSPYSLTDLNGDGIQELVVTMQFSATTEYTVFSLQPGGPGVGPPVLEQVRVAEPGAPPFLRPGRPLTFWSGGDAGFIAWIHCEGYPQNPVLVITETQRPIEGPGSDVRQVDTARLVLRTDGTAEVIGSDSYTEPATSASNVFTGRACGLDLWPAA